MPGLVTRPAMKSISDTELRDLLLPTLACLPAAFLSPRPPPALFSLLSPVLRQRVHLFTSGSTSTNQTEHDRYSSSNWLRLLTWDPYRAERLCDVVASLQLEPHPVSGELELFGDTSDAHAGKAWYRQLDVETVQARCDVHEHRLGFVWSWCTNDTGAVGLDNLSSADVSDAWKIAEVVPLEGAENLQQNGWRTTLEEALAQGPQAATKADVQEQRTPSLAVNGAGANLDEDDDDDAYWAAYDRSETNTPARRQSFMPESSGRRLASDDVERDYFARYGAEVQPALDAHDPDEEQATKKDVDFQSTLTGEVLSSTRAPLVGESPAYPNVANYAWQNDQKIKDLRVDTDLGNLPHDAPLEAQEPASASVASLEASVTSSVAVETSVKHHISGEIKSLFRLAQGVGMDRSEFERVVHRELDVLGLIEL